MIVLKIQLDKIKYFAIRVELQVKVSPHIHSFIHIHAAKLTQNPKEEHTQWNDGNTKTDMRDLVNEKDLFEVVKAF